MNRTLFLVVIIALFCGQCRQKEFILTISGQLSDAVLGGPVSNADLTLQVQVLSGGVFNTTFQSIENTTTDGTGNYEFVFDRENAVEYRIVTEANGYIERNFGVNPENLAPGEVFNFDISIIPRATHQVHLVSLFPQNEFDSITYKNLAVEFNCACCDSEDRIFGGMNVDTTLSCDLYGESWLKYFIQIEKDTASHTFIDSVYCPAFEITTTEIVY